MAFKFRFLPRPESLCAYCNQPYGEHESMHVIENGRTVFIKACKIENNAYLRDREKKNDAE